MIPNYESLRCFVAAAEHLNFRAAARMVALSPGALSQRIGQLESQFETLLFERTTRRVSLTRAGEALLPQAKRALEEADRCHSVLTERTPFDLTLGTRYELGMSWIVPSLKPLSIARPERLLHLIFGDSAELLTGVRRGSVDAVVTSARLTEQGLGYEVLHEETYLFVAAPGTLRQRHLGKSKDASNFTLLDYSRDLPLFRYFQDSRAPGEVWQFRHIETLGTIAAVRHRLIEGAGVAVLPEYFIRGDVKAKRLKVLFPEVPLLKDYFRLVWRAGHTREAEIRLLAAELRARPLV